MVPARGLKGVRPEQQGLLRSGQARNLDGRVRAGESGGKVRCYFCPDCGSTVFWKPDKFPTMIGVAVGAIADPKLPAPVKSVFEQSKHAWVEITGVFVEHLQYGSVPKTTKRRKHKKRKNRQRKKNPRPSVYK